MEVLNEIFLLPQNLHQELYLMIWRHGELYLCSKFRETPAVFFSKLRARRRKIACKFTHLTYKKEFESWEDIV